MKQKKLKRFYLPVTWEVWDKVAVDAETLEDAILYLKENIDIFPLGCDPEYIEGTYKIDDGDNGEASTEETIEYLKEFWNLGGGIDGEEL